MPIIVQDIIKNRPFPATVMIDDDLIPALDLMQENDFSALPVINDDKSIRGIVTIESIIRVVKHSKVLPHELKIRATINPRPRIVQFDEELSEVLRALNEVSCVLVSDQERKLLGIVTSWDTSEYYRQRAEDLMFIGDVEAALKEHISAAFSNKSGEIDQIKLNEAISIVASASRTSLAKETLYKYFSKNEQPPKKPDERIVSVIIGDLRKQSEQKSLDNLTLNELSDLLFSEEIWTTYSATFTLPKKNVKEMLDGIRQMRNDLAHFKRDKLSSNERDALQYCLSFFQDLHSAPKYAKSLVVDIQESNTENEIIPTDEELSPAETRYAKLAVFLQERPRSEPRIVLTFEQIEQILENQLPPSAWEHRSWWANDSVSHVQSQQWLDAGWRVASVNMTTHQVIFYRNREREERYIDFFSTLLNRLRETNFPAKKVSPTGTSWITVFALTTDRQGQVAFYNFSFARGNRFRVELYIDTQNQELNHQIFDALFAQKSEIENELGISLSWEKLETKRASRIAIYQHGSITDDSKKSEQLIGWAVEAMFYFASAFTERTNKALKQIT